MTPLWNERIDEWNKRGSFLENAARGVADDRIGQQLRTGARPNDTLPHVHDGRELAEIKRGRDILHARRPTAP
jgi:hypothetical protein